MKFTAIRKRLAPLRSTPLHPQWLIYRYKRAALSQLVAQATDLVLDIGAGHEPARPFLPEDVRYLALDYFDTAVLWYKSRPNIFGDGHHLPIASDKVDMILLLDVLEHLPHPENCVKEMWRVLKPGGVAIIQVPFLYPVHDAPLDFHRWTYYGLQRLASRNRFSVEFEQASGKPVETAALLCNLAFSQTILSLAKRGNPLTVLGVFLPFAVLMANITAWLFSHFSTTEADGFMPQSYRMVWTKSP